jgi:Putative MetA-pathway of phenol degradation
MPKPQRVTVPEMEPVSGVRLGRSRCNRAFVDWDRRGRWREETSLSRWFSLALVLAALTVSGCMTTGEYAREDRGGLPQRSGAGVMTAIPPHASMSEPVYVARLQSPAAEIATQEPLPQPPLPDTALPLMDPNAPAATFAPASVDTATNPPQDAAAFPPADGPAAYGNSPSLRGLSSISRNRRANRMPSAALLGSGDMSSILRERIQGEGGEPEYNYPDIHADPAKIYHDRFGIDEEHDRWLFPWIMNLIFEDRWLLSENDPTKAVQDQFRRRMKIDIRDPDPDTANFPNGAYTLPKGRLYVESSPVGFYGASKNTPRIYQWEYLLRYGLTDNLEFRIFSNGFTAQAGQGKQTATTGYSPLAFDFKANFWEENTKYHIPAMGAEIYLQTTFGSPAFNSGTQPSMNLLFDQSLPLEINFEYNFGITGVQNGLGQTKYQFSYQWSFQRELVKDFDIFVQGFYNESSLPRLLQFRDLRKFRELNAEATIPTVTVIGVGAIWTVNDRLAVFGSYNFGLTPASPRTIALTGFAVAF